jgi:hypothetical protein
MTITLRSGDTMFNYDPESGKYYEINQDGITYTAFSSSRGRLRVPKAPPTTG